MLLDEPRTNAVAIEEITDANALAGLRPEWATLWSICEMATPFQSPDWLLAWWRYFGTGNLFTLALRSDDRLVGLAPLMIVERENGRTVRLIGQALSDYLDILAAPGFEAMATTAIFERLNLARDGWTDCDFEQLRPSSPLLQETARSPRWVSTVEPQVPCPVVEFADEGDTVKRLVSANFLKNLNRDGRLLSGEGRVTFLQTEERNFPEIFAALLHLHRRRWERRSQSGVLADDHVCAFHREAARGLLDRDVLRLYALRLNDEIIACHYGFLCHGQAFYYLGGFDPRFEHFGIGNQLVRHALERAHAEGAGSLDFLRGREAYKYRWGARDRPTFRLRLWHGQ